MILIQGSYKWMKEQDKFGILGPFATRVCK